MQPSLQRVKRMKQAVGNAARDACGCQLSQEVARHLCKPDTAHAGNTSAPPSANTEPKQTLSDLESVCASSESSWALAILLQSTNQSNEAGENRAGWHAKPVSVSIDCEANKSIWLLAWASRRSRLIELDSIDRLQVIGQPKTGAKSRSHA